MDAIYYSWHVLLVIYVCCFWLKCLYKEKLIHQLSTRIYLRIIVMCSLTGKLYSISTYQW